MANKNWESLTWDDLEEWAGSRSVSRGRIYQREQSVSGLVISKEGRLLANVLGGDLYVVAVWLDSPEDKPGSLQSKCTCPVGIACKHAVAVIAEYLSLIQKKKAVQQSSADDPRWKELAIQNAASSDDEPHADEEQDEGVQVETSSARRGARDSRQKLDEKIQQHIRAKSKEELADLVWSLLQRFPELHEEFRERIALQEGNVDRLVKEARRELHRITASPGWVNSWNGEGSVPDYTPLIHRLERLVLAGHAGAVVELGREIIACGIAQAAESNDEGETGMAFAECLPVIFQAVSGSNLSPAQKLLFAIDARLRDDYDLIGDEADELIAEYGEAAAWSEVADELARRLANAPPAKESDDFSRNLPARPAYQLAWRCAG